MNISIISFDYSDSVKYIYGKLKENDNTIEYCLTGEQTPEKINEMSALAEEKSDAVIYIGGLGMSSKDVLKEVLSVRYNVNLVYTQKSQDFFQKYIEQSRQYLPPVYVQERLLSFPEGFDCFPNEHGYELAATGRFGGREIFLLPDNLSECAHIYGSYLENYFSKKDGSGHKVFNYKVFGLRKDEIEEKLGAFDRKTFKISVFTDFTGDTRITVRCTGRTSQNTIDEMNAVIMEAFKENLYAVDDFSLGQVAVDLLKLYKHKLSVAESITGGGIASEIVSVAGASDVLYEGCTTYSNEAKQARLLVKQQTLSQFGAVSSETAYQMATGLLKTSGGDIVLATTGIAGPSGATQNKPLGLTFISVGDIKGIHIHKYIFSGDRNEVRKKAVNTALYLLVRFIKKRK